MQFIITDLEWNGAYSRKAHGYFNEIIEIGAVKVDESLCHAQTFHVVIRPAISPKLSSIVTDLTNITSQELEKGLPFGQAMALFADWAGTKDAILATWSNTDLLVLMENFRFYYGDETLPFASHYVDLQRYCQKQMKADTSQQMGLSRAAEQLGISEEGMALHRALDDSILTAKILKKLYQPGTLKSYVLPIDENFYKRIHFKSHLINDLRHPAVSRRDFRFQCETCGRRLALKTNWHFRNHAFCADLECRRCKKAYLGRVQLRQLFDSVDVKRKLIEKKTAVPATVPTDSPAEGSAG